MKAGLDTDYGLSPRLVPPRPLKINWQIPATKAAPAESVQTHIHRATSKTRNRAIKGNPGDCSASKFYNTYTYKLWRIIFWNLTKSWYISLTCCFWQVYWQYDIMFTSGGVPSGATGVGAYRDANTPDYGKHTISVGIRSTTWPPSYPSHWHDPLPWL